MKLEIAGRSDVRKRRSNNEDNFLVDLESGFFIVADGMGGHNHGEIASKLAVDVTRDAVRRFVIEKQKAILGKIDPQASERANQLASAVRLANQVIFESAKSNPVQQGMGTTVDAVCFYKDKAAIAHVGDSRIYLERKGKLEQVTADHSLVAEQVRKGLLTPEEAENHPQKNILTRALGVDAETQIDLYELDLSAGDRLIGCTDGLNKMVTDAEILKAIEQMKTPKMIAEHLVDLANAAGGVDNVTVIVAQLG